MITTTGWVLTGLILGPGRTAMRAVPGRGPLNVAAGPPRAGHPGTLIAACPVTASPGWRAATPAAPALALLGPQRVTGKPRCLPGRLGSAISWRSGRSCARAVAGQARTAPGGRIRPRPRKRGLGTGSDPAMAAAALRCAHAGTGRLSGARLGAAVPPRCRRYRACSRAGGMAGERVTNPGRRCGHRPARGAEPGKGQRTEHLSRPHPWQPDPGSSCTAGIGGSRARACGSSREAPQ